MVGGDDRNVFDAADSMMTLSAAVVVLCTVSVVGEGV